MKDAVKIDFESETKSGVGTKIKVLTKIEDRAIWNVKIGKIEQYGM